MRAQHWFKNCFKSSFFLASVLAIFALSGCGQKKTNSSNDDAPPAKEPSPSIAPTKLLHADLERIRSVDMSHTPQFDLENEGIFSQVFGGTASADVESFLSARLQLFISDDDDNVQILPADLFKRRPDDATLEKKMKESNAKVGAANIGLSLWLEGLMRNKAVYFVYHGQMIPVQSSRVGIMLIGPGYINDVTTRSGKKVIIPHAYRLSILAHEARHSDCTGGISEAEVILARGKTTSRSFANEFPARACGHVHTYCPPDHQYHDLAACDQESWGAYSVGALLSRGLQNPADQGTLDWEIMNANAIDSESRIMVKKSGIPDMTSSGYRAN